jgi:protein phosphatase 2C family protein 2/3
MNVIYVFSYFFLFNPFLGDHAVKNVGVIPEPEVKIFEVTESDQFMIMASDGVWEFISSQEAVDIVKSCLDSGVTVPDACQELIENAAARWQEEEGDYRDDVSNIYI